MLDKKLFEYPLNTQKLIRKKRILREKLLQQGTFLKKRIAVLGGSTTNELVDQLELFLLYRGIKPDFFQSEYNQYEQDAILSNEKLEAFSPDLIYIHTNWRNIKNRPQITDSEDVVSEKLKEEKGRFASIWKALENRYSVPIIQNNFERPLYRLLGNRDVWDFHGFSNFVSLMNQYFYNVAREDDHLMIHDLSYLASDYGLSRWHDTQYWYLYKYAMSIDAMPYIAKSLAELIGAIYGKAKKVLVLDCDQTLWGGIIADDGESHIKLGNETSDGEAYKDFQAYLKQLKNRGVVLTINSKNDEKNVLAGLNHPESILSPQDFASIQANWEDKDYNISKISLQLSLGTDSMVFVDDNPMERELVRQNYPEVAIPEIDTVEKYIMWLDHGGYFESVSLSQEDLRKTELYVARAMVSKLEGEFKDRRAFLKSLDMHASITSFQPEMIDRIAQLTNKTNQFNLTTRRYTAEEIEVFSNSDSYVCLTGRLVDRFADQGIVTVVIGEKKDYALYVLLWLMSCRVLKRGLEDLMMNVLVEKAKMIGCSKIYGEYIPTQKNGMVSSLYPQYGFKLYEQTDDNVQKYVLLVKDYVPREVQIDLD